MKISIDNKFSAEAKIVQGKPQYQTFEYFYFLFIIKELYRIVMTMSCLTKE
jgi:hypothetical protein